MEKIWKYPLKITGTTQLEMPESHKVLAVKEQLGTPCIWVSCDEESERTIVTFFAAPTGGLAPNYNCEYLDTILYNDGLVFHYYKDNRGTTAFSNKEIAFD